MMGQRRVACSALAAMLGSVGLKKSTLGSAFCIRMLICKMQISGQVYLDITLSFAYLHEKIHEFRLRHANFGELGEGHSDHLQSTQIQTQTSVMGKSFETDIVILMNWETQLHRASAEFILKSGLCLWDTSGPPPPVALAHGLFLDASERSFPHFWFRTFHYMKASLADGITNSSPFPPLPAASIWAPTSICWPRSSIHDQRPKGLNPSSLCLARSPAFSYWFSRQG